MISYFYSASVTNFIDEIVMKRLPKLLVIMLLLHVQLHAQKSIPKAPTKPAVNNYAAVDKKALAISPSTAQSTPAIAQYIDANFTRDEDKARAAFIWLATNVKYDVDNMFSINFYEKPDERIAKTFATQKGICIDYANIFHDIVTKCGIQAFVVSGYTKQQGFTDYIPHAWCAAMIGGDWFLFDPTWGSGYISNGKFVPHINNDYFMAKPTAIIKSHMPFDPIWECLTYPITNAEFYQGSIKPDATKPVFNYKDSIQAWNRQSKTEQTAAAARRVEGNGVKNSMIYDMLVHLKREVEYDKQLTANNEENAGIDLYNAAVADYNKGINDFNDFVNYRNSQFKPMREDADIQAMVDLADANLSKAIAKLTSIKKPKPSLATLIITLRKSIDDVQVHVGEQKDFLVKYFSKSKIGRKSMFYKYTWMGIPVN